MALQTHWYHPMPLAFVTIAILNYKSKFLFLTHHHFLTVHRIVYYISLNFLKFTNWNYKVIIFGYAIISLFKILI